MNIQPDLIYRPHFYDFEESKLLFEHLLHSLNWQKSYITIFGKHIAEPRLTAWYGSKTYTYSGKTMPVTPWEATLFDIKTKIENDTKLVFNSVLCNLYRNGSDSMGWHADNEASLGPRPTIASVSFGASRIIQFRENANLKNIQKLALTSGSLLIMQGTTQDCWKHQIAKTTKVQNPRINLTFRNII